MKQESSFESNKLRSFDKKTDSNVFLEDQLKYNNRLQNPLQPPKKLVQSPLDYVFSQSDSDECNYQLTDEGNFQDEYLISLKIARESRFLINPDGKFYQIWNIINTIIIIYISIILPYKFSFVEDPPLYSVIIEYIFDFVFFLDIIVTFFVPYYDKSKYIVSHKRIAFYYIFSIWFWIDTTSIIPVDLIFEYQGDYSVLLKILKLPRFYKMVIINSSNSLSLKLQG